MGVGVASGVASGLVSYLATGAFSVAAFVLALVTILVGKAGQEYFAGAKSGKILLFFGYPAVFSAIILAFLHNLTYSWHGAVMVATGAGILAHLLLSALTKPER
mgnify:CR=1 FL=1